MKQTLIVLAVLLIAACTSAKPVSQGKGASVEVFVDDGSVQCGPAGVAPQATAKTLIDHGIKVSRSTCGYMDGMAFPSVCGGGDGSINVHTIAADQLQPAVDLGYTPVSKLPSGYVETCD